MSVLQPTTDAEWKAKNDADTWMEYLAIKKNTKRRKAARAYLKANIKKEKEAIKATG